MNLKKVERHDGVLFIPIESDELRVRYSISPHRDEDRKNTLLTLVSGDIVFFGIARCNMTTRDQFTKKGGQAKAVERLIVARRNSRLKKEASGASTDGILIFSTGSMLGGWAPASNIEYIDVHFDTIDAKILAYRKLQYQEERRVRQEEQERMARAMELLEKQEKAA